MNMNFCPQCGEKLGLRERPNDAPALYCGSCGDYRFPIFSAAVAAVVLNEAESEMVLIRQYDYPTPVLVTGYIDKGESAEEALVREVKEELGMTALSHRFLKSHYYAPSETLMLNYAVTVAEESASPNWEVDSWEWVSVERAREKVKAGGLAEVFLLDYETWWKDNL